MSGIKSLRGRATVLTGYVTARISKGIYTQKKTSLDVSQVQHLAHYTQQRAKHETPLVQSWCTWIETRHANPSPCIQENYMRMHNFFCLLSSKLSHILTLLQSLHTFSCLRYSLVTLAGISKEHREGYIGYMGFFGVTILGFGCPLGVFLPAFPEFLLPNESMVNPATKVFDPTWPNWIESKQPRI